MKLCKRTPFLLLFVLLLTVLLPVTAWADTGPKPSVQVTIKGLGDAPCYATLLSEQKSTGPTGVWSGNDDEIHHNNTYEFDRAIWDAFTSYEDPDGFYFLQWSWQVNETKQFRWGYYPPSTFKILLYFPEQNQFYTSGICERYAFDSYFTIDVSDRSPTQPLKAAKSYDYTLEILSLLARTVITIALEIGIAWLFGFRSKEELKVLVIVNVITQVALNVALNIVNYNYGQQLFVWAYFGYELLVFIAEAIAYCIFLERVSGKRLRRYIGYALIANTVSFAAGFAIAKLIPGIF